MWQVSALLWTPGCLDSKSSRMQGADQLGPWAIPCPSLSCFSFSSLPFFFSQPFSSPACSPLFFLPQFHPFNTCFFSVCRALGIIVLGEWDPPVRRIKVPAS